MTASHTPTPWVVEKNSVNAENGSVVSIAECGLSAPGQSWSGTDYSTREHQAANAEFIVRACNSHDQLVAALKAALATIEDYVTYEHNGDPWTEDARAMGEMDIDDYSTDGRLEAARAALAAAGAA
jgi:hypothetical protein